MALGDLFRAIEDDAAAERADVEQRAAAEAASILEQARREADALQTRLITTAEADGSAAADRARARGGLAAAAIVREGREAAFLSVLADLREELAGLRASDAYPRLFRALVAESRRALPEARELHVDPRDRVLAAGVAGDIRVRATLDTGGGVELVAADGRTLRNTIEQRLANAEPLLRAEFLRWLAAEAEPGEKGRA